MVVFMVEKLQNRHWSSSLKGLKTADNIKNTLKKQ